MAKSKPTLADATRALEATARVATNGTAAQRAGRAEPSAEPDAPDEPGTGDRLVIYQGKGGIRVELSYSGDTMWASQNQMAELFGVTRASITRHLQNIYADGELDQESTRTESVLVGVNGQKYPIHLFSLDAIISVGYRVNSVQGTMFRRWATDKLVQYAVKGFAIDDDRLKEASGNTYFAELRERIRDIRASEANAYAELRTICSLCADYDPASQAARNFYMGVQNMLLWGVASATAPELVVDRADASQPNMGLTSWRGTDIAKVDVTVSKNYLANAEVEELNRLTGMVLDYFEDQTSREKAVSMAALESKLSAFLRFNERPILQDLGRVSRSAADEHAKAEYEKFAEARRLKRQDEGKAAISKLKQLVKASKRSRR